MSSLQLTEDPDRVRSFGGYNKGTYYAVEMRQDGYDVTPTENGARPHFRFDKTTLDDSLKV